MGVVFAFEDQVRRVPLAAPIHTWRSGRWVASLLDLWVASLLPGDLLDLEVELVVSTRPAGAARILPSVGALLLARAFVDVGTRRLSWTGQVHPAYDGVIVERVNLRPAGVIGELSPAAATMPRDLAGGVRALPGPALADRRATVDVCTSGR